ncbi:unnamed protein product [Phytophthora fragariaefolia]|uniref:Unnamed protein product n=1 Tax=Phytophthora fragariaefolia TaxID=1490495 RepID=A0A9W6Y6C5_9STRA|nr:unnamed protein product [Phytophthora fragariaefolia]
MEVYPPGRFEQLASVSADPVEIAVIYKSLKSLRILTVLECSVRTTWKPIPEAPSTRRHRALTSPMVHLPDDIFDDMQSLAFIHLAMFVATPKLPSFQGLTGLKSLTLAVFLVLQELPPLTNLQRLERFFMVGLISMDSLPDLSPVQNLKSFVVSDRGTWCCNGFLGDCDLSVDKCMVHPVWGAPAATCLPSNRTNKVATTATIELVKKFATTVCGPVPKPEFLEGSPTPDIMAPCNGTLYRQCPRPDNVESMCYNARFMGIACTTTPFPIEMRRRQIASGLGDKCDPTVEAWLGCK